jgi:hypothetical protein
VPNVHAGWTKKGTYVTVVTRPHATVMRVGKPIGFRDQLDTRGLMAAPGHDRGMSHVDRLVLACALEDGDMVTARRIIARRG